MKILVTLFCIFLIFENSHQKSTPEDDHYMAGVVEFNSEDKWATTDSPAEYTARTLAKYMEIINSAEAADLDILVFPEYTLNDIETASFVPDPKDKIAPCNVLRYEPIVRDLSCLATIRKVYLAVNLVEKAHCPEGFGRRDCPEDGLYRFNTNVVFDRQGVVVARYRKYNLFDEPGINTTMYAELVAFDTDFGVSFGTVTCFDILFERPAMDLIRNGITDIIYPTMWVSAMPFHTAVQVQQAWAFKNNVNLLAAGASDPEDGSTGTGVYAGRRGRIVSVINHSPETKLYVASVPKIDRPEAEVKRQPVIRHSPAQMNNLEVMHDQFKGYTTVDLPLEKNSKFETSLCQNRVCCSFTVDYDLFAPITNQKFYHYKLAAYDGPRSFVGFANADVAVCAVLACTGTSLDTCGTRFGDDANPVPMVVFNGIEVKETIELTGTFLDGKEVLILPTSLDTSMLPLEVDEIEYSERNYADKGKHFLEITHKLVKERSDLHSFAIWGRKINQSISGAFASVGSTVLVLVAVMSTSVLNKFN